MSAVSDNIEAIVAVAGLAGTGLATAGALLWKMSAWAAQAKGNDDRHDKAMKEVASRFSALSKSLHELANGVANLRAELRAREKSHDKLEGKLESNQEMMMRLTASVQQASSSLDAMWKTLQSLFPERVPKRASDRSQGG